MEFFDAVIVPLSFLALVMVSFYGWGSAVARYLFTDLRVGNGLRLAFGFATLLIFSGWLEASRSASRFILLGYLIPGVLFALWTWRSLRWNSKAFKKGCVVGFFIGALMTCVWLVFATWPFNYHDDFHGYLIFPLRILSEGFMGADFMNERRIAFGGGSGTYLNALFLSVLPLEAARIADLGVGVFLILFLAYEHSAKWLVGFGAAIFLAIYTPLANISTTYSGAAMAYALFLFSYQTLKQRTAQRYLAWGFLAGALASTKTNFMFPVAIAGAIEWLILAVDARSMKSIKLGFLALISSLAVMVPWFVTNMRFAGTPYYPFLGKGNSQTNTTSFNPGYIFAKYFTEILPFLAVAVAATVIFYICRKERDRRELLYAIFLTGFVVAFGAFICTTVAGGARYAFSASAIPSFFLIMEMGLPLKEKMRRALKDGKIVGIVFGASFLVLGLSFFDINRQHFYFNIYLERFLQSIRVLAQNSPVRPYLFWGIDVSEQRNRLRRVQDSVPAHENLLVWMDTPFLLDFQRNLIAAVDVPGCVGPDGGIPYDDSERIATYIRKHGFKYFAFSYRNEAFHSKNLCAIRLQDNWEQPRNMAVRICTFQEKMPELFAKYKVIYGDTYDSVVNLCIHSNGEPVDDPICSR